MRTLRLVFLVVAGLCVPLVCSSMVSFAAVPPGMSPDRFPAGGTGCLASDCHAGIEPIRAHDSDMAKQIYSLGAALGDPNGCVVCHGGNPKEEKDKKIAHSGAPEGSMLKGFNRHSASIWINDATCGQCHPEHTYAAHRSIMNTEAGKIQGAMWGWGLSGYEKKYGNYTVEDTDGPIPLFGTTEYKQYMQRLAKNFPDNFPTRLAQLPEADVDAINDDPKQAVFTYMRSQCQRCHVGVKGRTKRGDMRGMGCASCHMPYSNEGYYEGGDKTTPKDKTDHALVHSIQGTRKAKVAVNGKVYSGIPHETCASCHNRGKRIGVSFQGLMEFPYGTPYTEDGDKAPKLHTKYYNFIRDDVHHRLESRDGNPAGGLLCQDCHTTTSMHGNGNITGTLLANVEIECSDCHGTADSYPWELPLGWGDEFSHDVASGNARGLADKLTPIQQAKAFVYDKADGYMLTARGNPFGNVVRRGEKVIVHSASGLDFEVPTLKSIARANTWKTPQRAIAAKLRNKKHMENLECYACHSAWAPQCYGCHVKVDYTAGKTDTDWVASGNANDSVTGHTAESRRDGGTLKLEGKASEGRSYLRWEDPVLGVNGEGRVSPIIPGCQQIITVINRKGETVVHNNIFRSPAGTEGAGPEGQRTLDMAPVTPHTTDRQARSCESCHTKPKSLGYGTHDGAYMKAFVDGVYVDVSTTTGEIVSEKAQFQIPPIKDLPMDLDQVITRDGKQLQTVGHNWPLSAPLSEDQRTRMERTGTCIACHQLVPDATLTYRIVSGVGKSLGLNPVTDQEHTMLIMRIMGMTAYLEVYGPFGILAVIGLFWYQRKKCRREK